MKRKGGAMTGYDYSTPEARQTTAEALFERARIARGSVEQEWTRYNDYYNGAHDGVKEQAEYARNNDVPFMPAVMPDPWIMVESQIDPNVPEPEFHGRDDDMDDKKARRREFAVRYIVDNNRLADMNTRNERRLLKYGDAFWKAYWDGEMRCGIHEGDIRVKDIPVDAIYPDPSIRDGTLQDAQYIDYIYRMHKVHFAQVFRAELKKLGVNAEDLMGNVFTTVAGTFDQYTELEGTDDTVEVLEHWFRQPEEGRGRNGELIPAGAIACSIQAGGRELRYIPNYWERTCRQNKLFPFVHYWRIQDENRFWNKSELFPILDMVDVADRKLSMALLNDAMMGNDILIVEEDALADGEEVTNEPGAVVHMKQNRSNGIRRLGGMNSTAREAVSIDWVRSQVERANRNYETNLGKESSRQTTATGLAMLRSDAESQSDIKKSDRNAGFERLYELLDWLALEFFDDGRMLFIGADPNKDREAQAIRFNSDEFSGEMPQVTGENGNVLRESWTYWPKVDVKITAGDSVVRGKQATLQALQALTQSQITAENWRLFAAQLNVLDIPGKNEIIQEWENRFMEQPQAAQQPSGSGGPGQASAEEMADMLAGSLPGMG